MENEIRENIDIYDNNNVLPDVTTDQTLDIYTTTPPGNNNVVADTVEDAGDAIWPILGIIFLIIIIAAIVLSLSKDNENKEKPRK